jgi:hypothetical protein
VGNKTKKVAWFVSNCNAKNNRLQYARELAKHIQVDIYGSCGSLNCGRGDEECMQMLHRDYKFYLAFENSNCKDYITEKLFTNALGHGILPIVMGASVDEYRAVAPHKSFIHVDEFDNAAAMANHLLQLDEDDELYNSYFEWQDTGAWLRTGFFCRVCAMLHYRKVGDTGGSMNPQERGAGGAMPGGRADWWQGAGVCQKGQGGRARPGGRRS